MIVGGIQEGRTTTQSIAATAMRICGNCDCPLTAPRLFRFPPEGDIDDCGDAAGFGVGNRSRR